MIAILAISFTACGDKDDEVPEPTATTGVVTAKFVVKDSYGSYDVKSWNLTVDLDTESGISVKTVNVTRDNVSFSDIAPGNYEIDAYGTVVIGDNETVEVDGYIGVQITAGKTENKTIDLEF